MHACVVRPVHSQSTTSRVTEQLADESLPTHVGCSGGMLGGFGGGEMSEFARVCPRNRKKKA
jgi:hypothetical protein